ncbi:hypothetical protein CALCODRAFT_201235 [Calocera cornea HHB12733]|uniref:Uncharacterized protein n=1 Tax=Calocera cornea HHB12733 TaxID=1353952 RepID=A0A165C530_9BASI|nr:hypothetical protein CALCODRAFT_201235 [Calocera cornea HHB12733]
MARVRGDGSHRPAPLRSYGHTNAFCPSNVLWSTISVLYASTSVAHSHPDDLTVVAYSTKTHDKDRSMHSICVSFTGSLGAPEQEQTAGPSGSRRTY